MAGVWALAALWLGLALIASLISIWLRISTALSEIVVGTIGQLIIGAVIGSAILGTDELVEAHRGWATTSTSPHHRRIVDRIARPSADQRIGNIVDSAQFDRAPHARDSGAEMRRE
jgi:hypothetical protein